MNNLADKLTVVITANLIPSHPSISLIKTVIDSLDLLSLDLNTKIVLAHDEIKPDIKATLTKAEQRFSEYFKNLHEYCVSECKYKNVQIVKRDEWGHLTKSVQTGFSHVTTDYVLLIQHDLPFIVNIDIYALLAMMINNKEVKHLRFNRSPNLPKGWDGGQTGYKPEEYLAAFRELEFDGIKVCKTLAWSDENHLTSKEYYNTVVFPDCSVETSYTYMEGVLNRKNPDDPARYGTYVYGTYGQPQSTKNLDGANTYLQDFIFDPEYCPRAYPDLIKFNISAKGLKELYVDRYGYVDCVDPEFDAVFYSKSLNIKFNDDRAAYKHWLSYLGKRTGSFYAPDKHTALKLVLKTKDEEFLLEPWLQYHIALVGNHNIIVIDNNSTSQKVQDIYKKYNVLVYPFDGFHEHLCNSRRFLNFYEDIQKCSLFHAILDTDEYLCFYDYEREVIDNSKLVPFLKQNKNNHTLTTSWIFNNYYGKDYENIVDVTDFSVTNPWWDIVKGKAIFLNSTENSMRTHNSISRDLTYCPELLMLHLHKTQIEDRIKSKINHVMSENPEWSIAEFFDKNESIKENWKHNNREISEYYKNPAEYLLNLSTPKDQPFLYTDVIQATIDGRSPTTKLRGFSSPFPKIFNSFVSAKLNDRVHTNRLSGLLAEVSKIKNIEYSNIDAAIQQALRTVNSTPAAKDERSLLKIILKTKNEGALLDAWLQYHAALVGWHNIVVVDNGSDCPYTLAVYEKYKDKPYTLFNFEGNPIVLPDTKLNQSFYDLVRATAKFLCFLDTDEFIAYFDPALNSFSFNSFLEVLQKHEGNSALSGLWLSNSPRLEDLFEPSIEKFKHFKLNPYNLSECVRHGKVVVSSKANVFNSAGGPGVNLCHSKDVPGVKALPNLLILHLDKTDLRKRMTGNMSIIKKRRLSNYEKILTQLSLDDLDTVELHLAKLEPLPMDVAARCKKINYHKLNEIVDYLQDPVKYIQMKADYNSQHVLATNIISATINQEKEVTYSAVYKGRKIENLQELRFLCLPAVV